MSSLCLSDGGKRNVPIEGDEASAAVDRKSKQINVSQLTRSMYLRRVYDRRVQDADFFLRQSSEVLAHHASDVDVVHECWHGCGRRDRSAVV